MTRGNRRLMAHVADQPGCMPRHPIDTARRKVLADWGSRERNARCGVVIAGFKQFGCALGKIARAGRVVLRPVGEAEGGIVRRTR